jgi:hypothetical protein
MNTRRTATVIGAATGGLLATAFLQTAVASASEDPTGSGDAATDTGFTWIGDNAPDFHATGFSAPPLFQQYEGDDAVIRLWPANFFNPDGSTSDVFDPSGYLGTMTGDEYYTTLFGVTDFGYVVTDAEGFDSADLPADFNAPTDGSVYNALDFGSGFENVYSYVAPEDPTTGDGIVTDTLVTPFGNFDLSPFFDAVDPASVGGPYAEGADVPDLYDAFGLTDLGGGSDLLGGLF